MLNSKALDYANRSCCLLHSNMTSNASDIQEESCAHTSDLVQALAALSHEDAAAIARDLLSSFVESTGAKDGVLYFLDLTSGYYRSYPDSSQSPPLDFLVQRPLTHNNQALATAVRHATSARLGTDIYLPIMRDDTCLAIVKLSFEEEEKSSIGDKIFPVSYVKAFRLAYVLGFAQALLESLKEPIGYEDVIPSEYYDSLVSAVSLSAGIGRVAMRELKDNGDLICIAKTGFSDTTNDELSFSAKEIPKPFLKALESKEVVNIKNAQSIPEIRQNIIYSSVRSFVVVPIRVGINVIGTLSLAAPITYEFSPFEITAFEAIANGAGVAITNFHNYRETVEQFDSLSDLSLSMSAVDVSQAVRHESINYLDRVQGKIASLLRKPKSNISELRDEIEAISNAVDMVTVSVNKIKMATKPPERELKANNIEDIWNETCEILQGGRLDPAGIQVRYQGKNVKIDMYPDWLRVAFFNLLLNSYDAYRRGGISGERTVLLKVVNLTSERVTLEYTDNAGGIEVHKLALPAKFRRQRVRDLDLNSVLFEPGVSSKGREGSGYGLYLARKGVQVHPGASLDLLPSRGGVRFRIDLPVQIHSTSNAAERTSL